MESAFIQDHLYPIADFEFDNASTLLWEPENFLLSEIDIPDDHLMDELVERADAAVEATSPSDTILLPTPVWPLDHAAVVGAMSTVPPNTAVTPFPVLQDSLSLSSIPGAFSDRPVTVTLNPGPHCSPILLHTVTNGRLPPTKRKKNTNTRALSRNSKTAETAETTQQPQQMRLFTQADHILRERRRRDDMAAKYLLLDSLLPPSSKVHREKAVVVDDAIQFVKEMQHRKKELKERRAHLYLQSRIQPVAVGSSSREAHCGNPTHNDIAEVVTTEAKSSTQIHETCSPLSSSDIKLTQMTGTIEIVQDLITGAATAHTTKFAQTSNSCMPLRIDAQVSEKEILLEMNCKQRRPNVHTLFIKTLESVSLDITHCSLQRLSHGSVDCIVSAKPQTPQSFSEMQSIARLLLGALRAAFESSV